MTVLALTVVALGAAATARGQPAAATDAATMYARACAACHGGDGSGLAPDHPLRATLDSPPADFTDPLFNSREPAADWALVIKYGGERLGLSQQMPAFEGALTDEQIDDLVTHVKSLADTARYPPGDLNFLRAIATIKAFPEDEALVINRYAAGDDGSPDSLRTVLYWARRLGARYQTELKLAHIDRDGRSELEEAEIGFKWAVRDNLATMSLFTLGLEAAFPLEDDDASDELIPYFSWAKGLSGALTLQGTLKAKLPVDDVDTGETTLSAILHWMRSPLPRAAFPALEATVTEPFGRGDTEITLIPQLYFGLTKGGHVALALGVEVPLTDLDYDYRLHSFLLWDIADGPFWKGW
jgi:mono/diheme cytochrome c family protein